MLEPFENTRWQGAPMGIAAINFPPTVVLNAAHSSAEGQEASPGITRHEVDEGGRKVRTPIAMMATTLAVSKMRLEADMAL